MKTLSEKISGKKSPSTSFKDWAQKKKKPRTKVNEALDRSDEDTLKKAKAFVKQRLDEAKASYDAMQGVSKAFDHILQETYNKDHSMDIDTEGGQTFLALFVSDIEQEEFDEVIKSTSRFAPNGFNHTLNNGEAEFVFIIDGEIQV